MAFSIETVLRKAVTFSQPTHCGKPCFNQNCYINNKLKQEKSDKNLEIAKQSVHLRNLLVFCVTHTKHLGPLSGLTGLTGKTSNHIKITTK